MTSFSSLCFYAIQTAFIFLESMPLALLLYIRWVPIILERKMVHLYAKLECLDSTTSGYYIITCLSTYFISLF